MVKHAEIKFGTDGWRGVIADNFNFDNVKIVSQAIADFIQKKSSKKKSMLTVLPSLKRISLRSSVMPIKLSLILHPS